MNFWELNFCKHFPLSAKWSHRGAPWFVLILHHQSFRFCFFKCRSASYLPISAAWKTLKSLCCKKGGTPTGSMKPLSHPAAPHSHEALSGCLLRLSLWRQPTQFGCSFPRRELPATCLLSLRSQRPHSPQAARRKAARYMKVCRPWWAALLWN